MYTVATGDSHFAFLYFQMFRYEHVLRGTFLFGSKNIPYRSFRF